MVCPARHGDRGSVGAGAIRSAGFFRALVRRTRAHHYDILHWTLDAESSGPSRVEGRADFPKNKIWNVHGAYRVELTYPHGVQTVVSDTFPNGMKFIGDEGWIFVSRGSVATRDPSVPRGRLRPLDASDEKLLDAMGVSVALPRSEEYHLNWLECVRSRQAPLVPDVDPGRWTMGTWPASLSRRHESKVRN